MLVLMMNWGASATNGARTLIGREDIKLWNLYMWRELRHWRRLHRAMTMLRPRRRYSARTSSMSNILGYNGQYIVSGRRPFSRPSVSAVINSLVVMGGCSRRRRRRRLRSENH
jgi:hypothetical protein